MAGRYDPALFERGGAIWALRSLTGPVLTALLDGLASAQQNGLDSEQSAQVEATLERIANAASAIPDSRWWGRTISDHIGRIRQEFERWAAAESPADRRRSLDRMRNLRRRLARRTRRNGHILEQNLDLAPIRPIFEHAEDLARGMPRVFRKLGKVVSRVFRILDKGGD